MKAEMLKSFWTCQSFGLILKILSVRTIKYEAEISIFSSTGRDQSSLCDTPLSVRPSVCKQFLLSHLLWGYLSQRLHYGPSLLALWCSCAPAFLIMILSRGAHKGAWPFSLCKSCYRIFSYTIYLRHLVIVLIWWQGGIDVHLWFWWGFVFQGPSKGCGQFSLYKSM